MRPVPLLVLLAGCPPWITADEEADRLDLDGDGILWPADCDPDDADVGEASVWYPDLDHDGWGDDSNPEKLVTACPPGPEGYVSGGGDCWDLDPDVRPNAEETCNNQVDDNCNEQVDQCVLTGIFDMPDGADAMLPGTQQYGFLGWAVRSGRLDTDDLVDLAVAAYNETGAAANSGNVYLYRGPVPAAWEAANPAVLSGTVSGGAFGFDLLLPGDLYGMGAGGTVVISAPVETIGYNAYSGRVYLFDQAPPPGTSTASSAARGRIEGSAANQHTGWALASLGDVSGDGLPDLAVSAPFDASAGQYAGAVYLFHGPIEGSRSVATADAALYGPVGGAEAGISVVNVGDVDGDGTRELLVGMVGDSCSAEITTGTAALVDVDITGSHVLTHEDFPILCGAGGYFGMSAAALGDLDGDGYEDIAVGAPQEDAEGYAAAGAVRIYRGPLTGTVLPDQAVATLRGERTEAAMGAVVKRVGDLDGDGTPDLAVLAAWGDEAGGVLSVFPATITGHHVGSEVALQVHALPSITFYNTNSLLAADLDDDGSDDLLIGAAGTSLTQAYSGAVYFIRGRGM